MAKKRHSRWDEQLLQMDIPQLDELIERARRRCNTSERETELQRLRKELFGRIASSGYSLEEIFSGTGRFPAHLIGQKSVSHDPRYWSANG